MKVAWTLPVLLMTSVVAFAQNPAAFVSVPTLKDLGLVGLALAVGVAGAVVVHRKNKN